MGVWRLFTLLCVANTVLCNTPGTYRPDITMLYKGTQKVCIAGSNTQGYGLTFMSKNIQDNVYVDDFKYRDKNGNVIDTKNNCDFENRDGDACIKDWLGHGLVLNSSSTNTLPIAPITDERWNDFYIHRTTSVGYEHNYKKSYEIINNFYTSFSIRSNQDAQILLCSTQQPKSSSCYWILIDAFENKEITAIRKCAKGVPNVYPKHDPECLEKRNEKIIIGQLLNKSKWAHFILYRVKGNLIRLWSWDINKGARDLLTYRDDKPFSLSHMYVRSLNSIADWKIHTYKYLITKTPTSKNVPLGPQLNFASSSICISFYVIMCKKCKMIIKLETEDGIEIARSPIIEGNPNETFITWRYVKIQNTNAKSYVGRNISIIPSLNTTEPEYTNPFWAIDNFRKCADNEIRVASTSTNINKELLCQSLKYPDWTFNPNKLLTSNEPPNCSDGKYIGLHCNISRDISCSLDGHLNNPCNYYKICLATREENGKGACTCMAGFKWTNYTDCTESCSYGLSYGYNCNKKCGKCKNRSCNQVTGECEQGCENGYQPPYCQNSLPRLSYPPIVTKLLNTTVKIQFDNVTITGSTDMVAYIYLECKKENVSWYNCSNPISYDKLKNEISIKNLENETSYCIRAVVYTTNGDSYRSDDLPFVIATTCKSFNTTTNDINEKELPDCISINATSELVTVHWKNKVKCDKQSRPLLFNIIFKCISDEWCKDVNDTVLASIHHTNSQVSTKLIPFTNYIVEFRPKREQNGTLANIKRTKTLFTPAAKPPAVRNFTAYSKNTTSISLRWLDPYPPYGLLENYYIKYCYNNSHSCTEVKSTTVQLSSCDLWDKTFKCFVTPPVLHSNIEYTINIQAKNQGTDYGAVTNILARTKEEKPSSPLNLTHNWENNVIDLYWNHPDIPNGRIRKFEIVFVQNGKDLANQDKNKTYFYTHYVNREMKYYTEKIPIIFRHSETHVVSVYAVNTYYEGDKATLIIDTPPETPELDGEVTVDGEKITTTTVTLSIPGAKKTTGSTSFLYVIVSTPVKSISKRGTEKQSLKKEILKRTDSYNNSWIALERDVNKEEITVILGNGYTALSSNLQDVIINNKPLEPDSEYIVTVLVINKYKNEISSSHYTTKIKTAANVYSELYALLLLLLLPVVGYFAYRYGKKKNDNPTYIEPNVPGRHSYLEVIENPSNGKNNPKRLFEHEYETVDYIQTTPTNTTEEHLYDTMNNLEKTPTYMNLLDKERALINSQTYANINVDLHPPTS